MISKVTIYGERCSGTNYLEKLLTHNFDLEIVWCYGWKHFFGIRDFTNTDNVLFIGIVRNIVDWINSLYREKYHLPIDLTKNVKNFLTNEFYSIYSDGDTREILDDRNIYTKERYKNIFELRHIKNKFLVDDMPTLVKNYLLITHESLLYNFENTMNKIKDFNLPIKNNIMFPINITYNSKSSDTTVIFSNKNKKNEITKSEILPRANLYYEKIIFTNHDK